MPTEDDLRSMLASAEAPNTLDAARVIARSRARRLPAQLAAGAVGVLTVAGIGVLAVQTVRVPTPTAISSAEDSMLSEAGTAESESSDTKRAPAELINACGLPLSESAPSAYGLELTLDFPEAVPAGATGVEGTVRLTNTSGGVVHGTTAASPTITLSRDGLTVWQGSAEGAFDGTAVDLQPGQSLDYTARFDAVVCDPALGESSPPPVGTYELSAAIDVFIDDSTTAVVTENGFAVLDDLVTSPRQAIELQ